VAEAHATADGHAAAPADGHGTGADAGHQAAGTAAAADGHAAAAVPVPGQGAIYIHPDNHVLHDAHYVPTWVKLSPFVAMLAGLALSWLFYIHNPELPRRLAQNQRPLYLFLLNKWYVDEIYDWLFVRPARWLGGFLWRRGDGAVIDGGINGLALGIVPYLTRLAGRVQSGYMFHYAFAMVLGIVALVSWMTLTAG
jgi:NADH-quinone oxidoreductase subunit L